MVCLYSCLKLRLELTLCVVLRDGRTPQLPHDKKQDDGAHIAGPSENVEPRGMQAGCGTGNRILRLNFTLSRGFLSQGWKGDSRFFNLYNFEVRGWRRRVRFDSHRIDCGSHHRDRQRQRFGRRGRGFRWGRGSTGHGFRRHHRNRAWFDWASQRLHGDGVGGNVGMRPK